MNKLTAKAFGVSSKLVYRLKAQSPQILLGLGIVGVATATFLACKKTLEVCDILDEDTNKIETIKVKRPDDKKALTRAYVDAGMNLIKAYALPAGILIFSIGCICKGHISLMDRNTALVGAYKLLEGGYNRYRNRVIEEYGEEADKMFYHNLRKEDIEIEEDGKTKKIKNADVVMENPLEVSYDRVFDESNPNWTGHPDMDIMFLKQTQNWANEVLNSRGFLFLNELYGELGFGPCEAGQFAGWVKGLGDGHVDFGIMDIYKKANRDFINGHVQSVLLTFNHDGYIADKI